MSQEDYPLSGFPVEGRAANRLFSGFLSMITQREVSLRTYLRSLVSKMSELWTPAGAGVLSARRLAETTILEVIFSRRHQVGCSTLALNDYFLLDLYFSRYSIK